MCRYSIDMVNDENLSRVAAGLSDEGFLLEIMRPSGGRGHEVMPVSMIWRGRLLLPERLDDNSGDER